MAILQEDDFKAAVPVFNSMSWGIILPSVEQAEEDYLKPILGTTEYDNLVTASGSLPYAGNDLALYDKLKAPLAQVTAFLAVPDLDVNLSTHGFTVHKDETSAPASQKRVEQFRLSQLRKAMSGFDRLLAWLEENKATYTDWAAGEGYTELKQGFVNTTAEFNQVVDIANSRHLFMRLRPYRTKVEQYELKSYLGEDLYNEIKGQIAADTLNADNTALLPFIHQAVCNRAIEKGLIPLNLQIDERGHLMQGIQESHTMKMQAHAKDAHMDTMAKMYAAEADAFFEKLRSYLNANASATKYAVYFNSDLYVDPEGNNPNEDRHENQSEDPVFIF
jgi:hypothetical protein